MKATEFCYWLQGMFELSDPQSLDVETTAKIKAHLEMVFFHDIDKSYPADQQKQLNDIHSQKFKSPFNASGSETATMRC